MINVIVTVTVMIILKNKPPSMSYLILINITLSTGIYN